MNRIYRRLTRLIVLITLCLIYVSTSQAQLPSERNLNIQVYEPDGKTTAAYILIKFIDRQDTSFNKQLLTDANGKIKLNIKHNTQSFYIGSENKLLVLDTVIQFSTIQKGATIAVYSKYRNQQLAEVNITPGKNTIRTAELKSYKASDYKVAEIPIGKNLLKMLPGISNLNGVYKINGAFDPIFFINGTRVLATAVENFPTDRMDRIEIVQNSELTSGLRPNQVAINIVTKKETRSLIGGIISLNNSFTQVNYGGFSTIYLTSKKIFGNVMLNTYQAKFDIESTSNWLSPQGLNTVYSRTMIGDNSTVPVIGTVSLNADLSAKIQLNYSFAFNKIDVKQFSNSAIVTTSGPVQEELSTRFNPLTISNFMGLNLKSSTTSNVFLRLFYNINRTGTILELSNITANYRLLNSSTNRNTDMNILLGSDFKLGKLAMELGGLYQRNRNKNTYRITNDLVPETGGLLTYNQAIYSLYLKNSYQFKLFRLSLLHRLDLTLPVLNENNLANQWNYLPSATVYVPTKHIGSFSLSASRQIILPGSDDLTNNSRQQSFGVINKGSVTIGPQTNLRINLSHDFTGDKVEWSNAISYENIKRLISYGPYRLREVDNLIERTKINLNKEKVMSLNPSVNFAVGRNTSITSGMEIGYYKAIAELEGAETLGNDGFFIAPSLNAVFRSQKVANFSFNLTYRDNSYIPFEVRKQQTPAISLAVSRTFLKRSLTLSASIYDALNTSNNQITEGISPDLQFLSNYQQSFRSIGLSVSYLFHAKAIKTNAGNNRGIKGRETKKINSN